MWAVLTAALAKVAVRAEDLEPQIGIAFLLEPVVEARPSEDRVLRFLPFLAPLRSIAVHVIEMQERETRFATTATSDLAVPIVAKAFPPDLIIRAPLDSSHELPVVFSPTL